MGMWHTSRLPPAVGRAVVPVMTMLLLAVYGRRTVARNFDWASESTLFKAAFQVLLPLGDLHHLPCHRSACLQRVCALVHFRLASDTNSLCRGRCVQTAQRCS